MNFYKEKILFRYQNFERIRFNYYSIFLFRGFLESYNNNQNFIFDQVNLIIFDCLSFFKSLKKDQNLCEFLWLSLNLILSMSYHLICNYFFKMEKVFYPKKFVFRFTKIQDMEDTDNVSYNCYGLNCIYFKFHPII